MPQHHDKFKLFTGPLAVAKGLATVTELAEKWVAEARVAPGSVGLARLDDSGDVVLSVGYNEGPGHFRVKFHLAPIGHLGGKPDLAHLEKEMARAAGRLENVVDHALLPAGERELTVLIMTRI
jgi:hypothetical protein